MNLKKNHELRFETKTSIKVTVESGICEHKGEELLPGKTYTFYNTKSFIFAHSDSVIRIEGDCENYISSNTSTPSIIEFYNKMLTKSQKTYIILGKGKSTFVDTLSNYIIRGFKRVLITELNPATSFFFPGCLSTDLRYIDNSEHPLVFYYGSKTVKNAEYYKILLGIINETVSKKNFDYHLIIGDDQYLPMIQEFDNLTGDIVVCKEEKLYSRFDNASIILGGVYETTQKDSFAHYFYGKGNNLTSYNITLKGVKIVRIGEEFVAPDYALPIGEERKIKSDVVVEVEPKVGNILGISFANTLEDVKSSPIKGFVKVEEIKGGIVKVMSAQPNPNCSFLVLGDF